VLIILYPPITLCSLGEELFLKIPYNGVICKTEAVMAASRMVRISKPAEIY
jgi:hypothetical protein